jgi:hypothetical protein
MSNYFNVLNKTGGVGMLGGRRAPLMAGSLPEMSQAHMQMLGYSDNVLRQNTALAQDAANADDANRQAAANAEANYDMQLGLTGERERALRKLRAEDFERQREKDVRDFDYQKQRDQTQDWFRATAEDRQERRDREHYETSRENADKRWRREDMDSQVRDALDMLESPMVSEAYAKALINNLPPRYRGIGMLTYGEAKANREQEQGMGAAFATRIQAALQRAAETAQATSTPKNPVTFGQHEAYNALKSLGYDEGDILKHGSIDENGQFVPYGNWFNRQAPRGPATDPTRPPPVSTPGTGEPLVSPRQAQQSSAARPEQNTMQVKWGDKVTDAFTAPPPRARTVTMDDVRANRANKGDWLLIPRGEAAGRYIQL